MDAPRQPYVQVELTHPSPRGSFAAATPPPTQPSDEAARSLISMCMCPSLYLAVYQGRTEAVMELLLQQQRHVGDATDSQATGIISTHGQCNILEVTTEKNTILHVAAEHGRDDLIRELYARFRDQGVPALLSRENSALDTPLHCAARAGHANAIAALLELGARDCGEMSILGCKNEAGDTALHLAARHGHGDTVRVLMLSAAEPAAVLNNAGVSPLYLAVMSGSVEAVRAITTHRDASSGSAAGPNSQNALHAAVFLQSSEMVELLLEWRPRLAEQADSSGSSPLHFASAEGNWAIVDAILGAAPPRTVYMKDSGGLSALHVAARMGHGSVVAGMIRMCPDAAELRDVGGGTLVHAAARAKRTWVVSAAIKSPLVRSLLNAQDGKGNTPLHLAVEAGAPAVVEALLRAGKVRAHVLNNAGDTAFDLAAKSDNFFTMVCMVVTLIAYGAQLRPQRLDDHRLELPSGLGIARKGIEKTSDSLAVVAVLLATSAYTAGFSVPGGYDGSKGKAVLDLVGNHSFKIFLFLDTVAVVTSVVAVILLVYGKASRSAGSWKSYVVALHCMWASFVSLLLAFYAALAAVATTKLVYLYGLLTIHATIFGLSIFIGKWIGPATTLRTVWRFLWRCLLPSYCKRRPVIIRRQYSLAAAAVLNLIPFVVASLLSFVGIGFIVASQRQGES